MAALVRFPSHSQLKSVVEARGGRKITPKMTVPLFLFPKAQKNV